MLTYEKKNDELYNNVWCVCLAKYFKYDNDILNTLSKSRI